MTDDVDETRDRMIADHVLRMHRYLPPGVEEGTPCHDILDQSLSVDGPGVATEGDAVDTSPFEKFDPLLHIGIANPSGRQTRSSKTKKKELLSIAFVKKYIQYAKSRPLPVLTKGAADHIVQVYASLRNVDMEGNNKKTSPLTARTLETLIRLATAHAKARLSAKVEEADAKQAEVIMRFALFKEVPKRQRRKKRKLNDGGAARKGGDREGSDEDTDGSDEEIDPPMERMTAPPPDPKSAPRDQSPQDPVWGDENRDIQMKASQAPTAAGPGDDGKIRPERLQLFRSRLANIFATRLQDDEQIFLTELLEFINEGSATDMLFGTAEATQACQAMQDNEELMISDGIVYKI